MSYIEREKLLKKVGELESLASKRVRDAATNSPVYQRYSTQMIERARFINLIKEQPIADVVGVVRCRDCKHFVDEDETDMLGLCTCKRIAIAYNGELYPERDFYCAYGERREK